MEKRQKLSEPLVLPLLGLISLKGEGFIYQYCSPAPGHDQAILPLISSHLIHALMVKQLHPCLTTGR